MKITRMRTRPLPEMRSTACITLLLCIIVSSAACHAAGDSVAAESGDGFAKDYPWLKAGACESLASRIEPPQGFRRVPAAKASFGAWLRGLPLRPGRPPVSLYNGLPKLNQFAHHAVLDVDVGKRDLQQCADAIIRLRAEYLRSRGCDDSIAFRFTSGDLASWPRWREGTRPKVTGNSVSWGKVAEKDASYANFRRYLDVVFNYAGTASLAKELLSIKDPSTVEIGDSFIQGGSPGHAVLVIDVAANGSGERVFLLAQSYMPAQDIHILKNPESDMCPWYQAKSSGKLATPEWSFRYQDLKRFPAARCSTRE